MNPKKEVKLTHKIAALCYLLTEALQDVGANSDAALEMQNDCKNLGAKCEMVLEELFQVKEVSGSTYLVELSNKVETVINKNYIQIKG